MFTNCLLLFFMQYYFVVAVIIIHNYTDMVRRAPSFIYKILYRYFLSQTQTHARMHTSAKLEDGDEYQLWMSCRRSHYRRQVSSPVLYILIFDPNLVRDLRVQERWRTKWIRVKSVLNEMGKMSWWFIVAGWRLAKLMNKKRKGRIDGKNASNIHLQTNKNAIACSEMSAMFALFIVQLKLIPFCYLFYLAM